MNNKNKMDKAKLEWLNAQKQNTRWQYQNRFELWLQTPYLHVYGHVCNVGTNIAYGAILYVEALQGSVLVFNTTISLGIIYGESYTSVDSAIYYSGSALTEWHIWSKPAGINMYWVT
jgi:hypothetical protein